MTYHMRIQLGPAHSSPITHSVCVKEPTGTSQWGISLRLRAVCQSALLAVATAAQRRFALHPTHNPGRSSTVLLNRRRSGRFCFQNLSLAKPELLSWGMRMALRFVVASFKAPWGAHILQAWSLWKKGVLTVSVCCHPFPPWSGGDGWAAAGTGKWASTKKGRSHLV